MFGFETPNKEQVEISMFNFTDLCIELYHVAYAHYLSIPFS